MTITARVHNRTITLPAEVQIAEGAEVVVTLPDTKLATEAHPTLYDSLKDFIGAAQGLPEDFASEHDHYIHGTAKRGSR